ncbi:MAG: type III-B CRISPR module RAMP protein Cmr4, partial [Sporolactobacillus sp.]|nr:type III-B CRISPR module RAMP protein Cmr4 [Sporolactobacillus sp.]
FAWVTCPFVLNRFNREMALFLNTEKVSFSPLPLPEANTVAEGSKVVVKDDKLVLEEYTIPVRAAKKTDALAVELEKLLDGLCGIGLTERLIVLDNDNFKNFVQYSTEVNARIRLSDDGTVEDGALWYEENVPPEAIFYSTLFVGNVRFIPKKGEQVVNVNDFITTYFPKVLQIGGDYTLGRGIVQTKFLRKGAAINA